MIWAVYGVMFLLAGAIVLLPLYRAGNAPGEDKGEAALAVYRQQLVELERDLASGALKESEADAARLEIHRRMLAAAGEDAAGPRTGLSTKIVTIAAILILMAATALYAERGRPGFVGLPADDSAPSGQQVDLGPQMGLIEDRLAGLEARLEEEPLDLDGWVMLGRSYRVMGRMSDAATADARAAALVVLLEERVREEPENSQGWPILAQSYRAVGRLSDSANAYGRAAALNPENIELRINQAETLVEALDGLVSPAAQLAFVKVREMDPGHPAPGFYLGLAEYQNNNTRGALEIWQALETGSPAGAPWLPALRGQIARARSDLGLEPEAGVNQ